MMAKAPILFLFAATAMLATPATAQRELNSANANPHDRMIAADAARAPKADEAAKPITPLAAQAMYNFAGCVVETTRPGVEKLLAKDFRTEGYRKDVSRLAKGHSRCAPGSRLGFSHLLFAGNLAEHLLVDEFSADALAADLAIDRSAAPIAARTDSEAISMCIAMKAPKETAALFRTEVMSDKEKTALMAIGPQLSGCVKQGAQFRTNRSGLRALLALAAYRIAVTSKEGGAG
jgi:hypothetical protein